MKSQEKNPRFAVLIADENLDFKKHVLDDPKVLGRQLIEVAGGHPVDEHVAIAILPNGDLEDIRLDESYDLRGRGAEKVLVARSDRSFKFKIDDSDLEWPRACITGFVLRKLAKLPVNYNLWQEIPGQHDRKISDTDVINLAEAGVERFVSLIDQTTEGDALPSKDQVFLSGHGYGLRRGCGGRQHRHRLEVGEAACREVRLQDGRCPNPASQGLSGLFARHVLRLAEAHACGHRTGSKGLHGGTPFWGTRLATLVAAQQCLAPGCRWSSDHGGPCSDGSGGGAGLMETPDLILLGPHEQQIRSLLTQGAGSERSAYMLFGIADIETDPWTEAQRRRLVSHRFEAVEDDDLVSASVRHVTWQTDRFMRLLNNAKTAGLIPALVHTHPEGKARFSDQDDRNEAELARTALLKGAPGLLSIVIAGTGDIAARIWMQKDKGRRYRPDSAFRPPFAHHRTRGLRRGVSGSAGPPLRRSGVAAGIRISLRDRGRRRDREVLSFPCFYG